MKQRSRKRVSQEVQTLDGTHYYVEYDLICWTDESGVEQYEVDWKTFSMEPVEVTWLQ